MNDSVSVLVHSCDSEFGRLIQDVLQSSDVIENVTHATEPFEAVQLAASLLPAVVIICESSMMPWQEVCSYIGLVCPQSRIILIVEHIDQDKIDKAMLLGVRQVLACSQDPNSLVSIIEQLQELDAVKNSMDYLKATDPKKWARLIAVSGAKGGIGKTTITINLGVALAQDNPGSVVIWDAYSQFGDVASLMGVTPARVLTDLTEVIGEIDDDLILDQIVHHSSGADILLTADKPVPAGTITDSLQEHVIKALRTKYRFIVVDTPSAIQSETIKIFSKCWRFLMITTLKEITGATDTFKFLHLIAPQYVQENAVLIVANRVGRGDKVKRNDLEALLEKDIFLSIPEDAEITQANNFGHSVIEDNPRCPSARAIQDLAKHLTETASTFGDRKK
ncbi:AAA family ATPase [bacterium]|nr:AAA family ATPase [bacterium]